MECVLICQRLFAQMNCSAELSVWRIKRSQLYTYTNYCRSLKYHIDLWYALVDKGADHLFTVVYLGSGKQTLFSSAASKIQALNIGQAMTSYLSYLCVYISVN